MKTVKLELTNKEYESLKNVLDKIVEDHNKTIAARPKKWIKQDGYMVNTKTGRRMDLITKHFL